MTDSARATIGVLVLAGLFVGSLLLAYGDYMYRQGEQKALCDVVTALRARGLFRQSVDCNSPAPSQPQR